MSEITNGILPPLGPAPVDGGFRREDAWVWGGSVVKGDDGRFYMYVATWPKGPTNPFSDWSSQSRVVLAVSNTAEGPYVYQGEVLPRRGGDYWDGQMTTNPTIHRYRDQYLLFYTGTKGSPDVVKDNQRIGYAVAPSPTGPWTRLDQPCLDVRPGKWDQTYTTNPAACVMEDGKILLLYKSGGDGALLQYGVAQAAKLGAPFERLNGGQPIAFEKNQKPYPYEDAYVWMQGGELRMIFQDITGGLTEQVRGGGGATSPDGVHWKLYDPPLAYSRTVLWSDGKKTTQGNRERAQLLIQDGFPTHLFTATTDGSETYSNAKYTFTMVDPFELL